VVRAPGHGFKGPGFKSRHLRRLGLLAKSSNPATGGPEQGIVEEAGLYNPDGTFGGDLPCFKLAVREEWDRGASWDWSIAPPGY
jgi:hypothetical protein